MFRPNWPFSGVQIVTIKDSAMRLFFHPIVVASVYFRYVGIGAWGESRAGMGVVEKRKILHCRESKPGRLACSSYLYRLSYPDSHTSVDVYYHFSTFQPLSSVHSRHMVQRARSANLLLLLLCTYFIHSPVNANFNFSWNYY
jgi:hypothetical protein